MICLIKHRCGLVEAHWQLVNSEVDDDQRHSTLLLGLLPGRLLESGPLLRRLLEEMKAGKLENFCAA